MGRAVDYTILALNEVRKRRNRLWRAMKASRFDQPGQNRNGGMQVTQAWGLIWRKHDSIETIEMALEDPLAHRRRSSRRLGRTGAKSIRPPCLPRRQCRCSRSGARYNRRAVPSYRASRCTTNRGVRHPWVLNDRLNDQHISIDEKEIVKKRRRYHTLVMEPPRDNLRSKPAALSCCSLGRGATEGGCVNRSVDQVFVLALRA